MFSFLLSFAMAACSPKYAIQQSNGSWVFYPEKVPGSFETEVDQETCEPPYRALKKSGDKFVIDKSLLASAKADEKKEKDDDKSKRDLIKSLKGKDLTDQELKEAVKILLSRIQE